MGNVDVVWVECAHIQCVFFSDTQEHGNVNISLLVVPLQCDTTVQSPRPLHLHIIVGFKGNDQVIYCA